MEATSYQSAKSFTLTLKDVSLLNLKLIQLNKLVAIECHAKFNKFAS